MRKTLCNPVDRRRTALAACIAATFSVAAPALIAANTWTVTTCADSGAGSLRAIVATSALNGDTVDLSHLTAASPGCANAEFPLFPATISLTTGSINIPPIDLTIQGPGREKLMIAPPVGSFRVLNHYYEYGVTSGTLHVNGMTISRGYVLGGFASYPKGGCIYSSGSVIMDDVTLTGCTATAQYASTTSGGALFAKGAVTITASTLSKNLVSTTTGGNAYGGAIYAGAGVTITNSLITQNHASANVAGMPNIGKSYGGAIAAKSVTIVNSSVTQNLADAFAYVDCKKYDLSYVCSSASGGGIFARNTVTLSTTDESGNSAIVNGTYGTAFGGGVLAQGLFSATGSSIIYNLASSPKFPVKQNKYGIPALLLLSQAQGGGVLAKAGAVIQGSTIAGNLADGAAGGLIVQASASVPTMIENTTISGNLAGSWTGGAVVETPATIKNSTISFNYAALSQFSTYDSAAGLVVAGSFQATLQGTLISNNVASVVNSTTLSIEDDLSTGNAMPTFGGSNNLVRLSVVSGTGAHALPPDTIKNACPLLGQLRDNGGPTATHALLSHSPAIDTGLVAAPMTTDQRGPGYARPSGANADIGAYEVQQDEIVFNANFEGCP